MCLIVLAYKVHPEYPLILAANRDEFLERPSEKAHFWSDAPHIFAGRDLRAGGTWLGITRSGRFAALTNYRDLRRPAVVNGPSRGQLVRLALDDELAELDTSVYEGFNLLHGPTDALMYHSNVHGMDQILVPGVHGLSNHLLNTPWPKVQRAKRRLRELVQRGTMDPHDLFHMMGDTTPVEDHELPDTGIGANWERLLGSIHIVAEGYGTRCSTVLLVDRQGKIRFEERGFSPVHEVRQTMRTN